MSPTAAAPRTYRLPAIGVDDIGAIDYATDYWRTISGTDRYDIIASKAEPTPVTDSTFTGFNWVVTLTAVAKDAVVVPVCPECGGRRVGQGQPDGKVHTWHVDAPCAPKAAAA